MDVFKFLFRDINEYKKNLKACLLIWYIVRKAIFSIIKKRNVEIVKELKPDQRQVSFYCHKDT